MKAQMIIPGCSTPLSDALDEFIEARHSLARCKDRNKEAEKKLILEMKKQGLTEVSFGKDRYYTRYEPCRVIGSVEKIMLRR